MARNTDSLQMWANPIGWLRTALRQWGIEAFAQRYYGTYRAKVVDNEDPELRFRCRLQIPVLGMDKPGKVPKEYWALPKMTGLSVGDSNQIHGCFFPPDPGDEVWVEFENGDQDFPVYSGGFVRMSADGSETQEAAALYKGIRTKSGHFIRFSDDADDLHILIAKGDGSGVPAGALIALSDSGILVQNDDGAHVWLNTEDEVVTMMAPDGSFATVGKDKLTVMNSSGATFGANAKNVQITAPGDMVLASGGKISLDAGKVLVGNGAGTEPGIRGMALMTNLITHVHITPGFGAPSSPQTTPPPMIFNELSEKVSIA